MVPAQSAMQSTSAVQQQAWQAEEIAPAEEVSPGIWAVALPLNGHRMPSSFGYAALHSGGVDIIDAGWKNTRVLEAWRAFLQEHGRSFEDIRTVTATHHHPDHLGLAGTLRELSGATLRMTRVEDAAFKRKIHERRQERAELTGRLRAWGVPEPVCDEIVKALGNADMPETVDVDEFLEEGHEFQFGRLQVTTLITSGHTAGHACFVDTRAGVIFTGDHVLPGIAPGIALGRVGDEDPILGYVEALRRMTEYDACEAFPGHEYRFLGLAERSRQIAAHHLKRTRALQVLREEMGDDATVWEYAERAPWSNGWEQLSGFLLYSALTQTEQHLFSLRAGRIQPWLDASWPGGSPTAV